MRLREYLMRNRVLDVDRVFLLAFPRIGFKLCLQAKGVNEEREREREKKN